MTLQTIINDLLSDLIEIGNVAVFINDVMVEMKTEEEHDDIIEKILRKMVENNLFIKAENICKI